jgi:hypothetical protein
MDRRDIVMAHNTTKAQREFFRLALASKDGNPWSAIGMVGRKGGAKRRMFDQMAARGWFDGGNCLTPYGREIAEFLKSENRL